MTTYANTSSGHSSKPLLSRGLVIYVFGGNYQIGPNQRKFSLIRPTGGRPYVFFDEDDARCAFRLAQHHSHLYRTTNCHTLELVRRGEYSYGLAEVYAPTPVDLPKDLADELFETVAHRQRELHVDQPEA